jgi:hypothetical protein
MSSPHSVSPKQLVLHGLALHSIWPSWQVQVLQPSPAGRDSPVARGSPWWVQLGASGKQARSVHATPPCVHVHVLHPSAEVNEAPSL